MTRGPGLGSGVVAALALTLLLASLAPAHHGWSGYDSSKELTLTNWGTLKIDWRSLMTNVPGVFAAGDIVRGASLVVWAIRDGRDAAAAIDSYITQARAKLAAE